MTGEKYVAVAGPWITPLEIEFVTDAVTHCWYGEAGKYHDKFEAAFARYVGVEHAVSLPSCTSGIHLALAALGLGSGDEVIVPDTTWIASAAPVSYVGAKPVFCDIDPVTWCLDPVSVERCVTERTRAIIAVDIYGGMPDWESIQRVAERIGVPIIEDAAEAIGSEYGGAKSGSFGRVGVFSFHGSKTMTTGEGGMLVTDDTALFERVLFLRDHGRRPGDVLFENDEVAYKYKMSSLQAALGLAQLARVSELVGKKREIFSWYEARLGNYPGIKLNAEPEGTKNSYWMSSAIFAEWDGAQTGKVMDMLRGDHQVDTRPFFKPLSSIPAYFNCPGAESAREANVVARGISSRVALNLPSALNVTEADVDRVVDALSQCQVALGLPVLDR